MSEGAKSERHLRVLYVRSSAALICALLLSGCAHTKPAGQALVALGAITLGFGALDAAGVLGSDCSTSAPTGGEAVTSCAGNGVVPQAVDILSIGIGAGLVAAGVVLWTQDSSSAPSNVSAHGAVEWEFTEPRTGSAQRGPLFLAGSPLDVAELHRCPIPGRELAQRGLSVCSVAVKPPELKLVRFAVHR